MKTKWCNGCLDERPISEFVKRKGKHGAKCAYCRLLRRLEEASSKLDRLMAKASEEKHRRNVERERYRNQRMAAGG